VAIVVLQMMALWLSSVITARYTLITECAAISPT
jgi:hypothetical protein